MAHLTKGKPRPTISAETKHKFVALYLGGEHGLYETARQVGISPWAGKQALRKAGIQLRDGAGLTDDLRAKMVTAYLAGATPEAAAESVGSNREVCRYELKKRGIRLRKRTEYADWTPEQLDFIRANFPVRGARFVADKIGKTYKQVLGKAQSMGVKSEVKFKLTACLLADRNTSVNWKYFETWSPNMAWLLGYIWADGTIVLPGFLGFGCQPSDVELLEYAKQELESTQPIYLTAEDRPSMRLGVHSVRIVESLMTLHGLVPRKSYCDPAWREIPDEYIGHFARGVLDGDGCIATRGNNIIIDFCNSPRFTVGLRDQLSRVASVPSPKIRVCKNNHLGNFRWSHRADAHILHAILYPPGQYPYLARKRRKLEAALAVPVSSYYRVKHWTREALDEIYAVEGTWPKVAIKIGISFSSLSHLKYRLSQKAKRLSNP